MACAFCSLKYISLQPTMLLLLCVTLPYIHSSFVTHFVTSINIFYLLFISWNHSITIFGSLGTLWNCSSQYISFGIVKKKKYLSLAGFFLSVLIHLITFPILVLALFSMSPLGQANFFDDRNKCCNFTHTHIKDMISQTPFITCNFWGSVGLFPP